MSVQATYDDVNLIVRLYELRREEKLRAARQWFGASFHASTLEELQALCPIGSEPNAYFRMVTSYWEMVASFVTSGVLNADLFFQSNRELLFVWARVRDLLPAMREFRKDPTIWKNLETVAVRYIEHLDRQSPELYPAFEEVVRKIAR